MSVPGWKMMARVEIRQDRLINPTTSSKRQQKWKGRRGHSAWDRCRVCVCGRQIESSRLDRKKGGQRNQLLMGGLMAVEWLMQNFVVNFHVPGIRQ